VLTIEEKLATFHVFVGLLSDSDSFVYLAVVHALAHLALRDRPLILHRLLSFLTGDEGNLKTRDKVLLSETLCLVIRKAGVVASTFATPVFRACFRLARWRPCYDDKLAMTECSVDLGTLRFGSISQELGLEAADSVLLRSSSISVCAEMAGSSGWSCLPHMVDIIDLIQGIFRMEKSVESFEVSSRRYELVENLKYVYASKPLPPVVELHLFY
jgi:hypothetical protein